MLYDQRNGEEITRAAEMRIFSIPLTSSKSCAPFLHWRGGGGGGIGERREQAGPEEVSLD
jgi:hypothetical protein